MAEKKPNPPEVQPPPRKRKEPPPARYQPNLTPLIDVLFLLLLFFLLGTRFRSEEGQIPATLPGTGGAAGPVSTAVMLKVRPAGANGLTANYEWAGMLLSSPGTLYDDMSRYANKDMTVQVQPTADVRWEFVVEAFNQAKRSRFEKIGFGQPGN
jgi:biopolymer transport protein ExbD